jgi:hypothetical protein
LARIIIPLSELQDAVIGRIAQLDRVHKQNKDRYDEQVRENQEIFNSHAPALKEILGWLQKAYEATLLARYRFSPPSLTVGLGVITFSVQPDKEARDHIEKTHPHFRYRWTATGNGRLGEISVPLTHNVSAPKNDASDMVREFYDRLPILGEYSVDVDVALLKRLGIPYDQSKVIVRYEEL